MKSALACGTGEIDLSGCIVNPRKLEHSFRRIHAGIPFALL